MSKSILTLLSIILMIGCGGGSGNNSNSKQVSVTGVEINGWVNDDASSNYLRVENGTYTFSQKHGRIDIEVPIKTIKKFPNLPLEDLDDFYLSPINSEDEYLQSVGNDIKFHLNNTEVINKLIFSKIGDENTLNFSYILGNESDLINQIENFDLWIYMDLGEDDTETTLAEESQTSNTKDEKKVDELLDAYEKYVDDYIKLYKKIQNGDTSSLTESVSMLESVEELSDKLENFEEDFTVKQLQRFNKIQQKIMSIL